MGDELLLRLSSTTSTTHNFTTSYSQPLKFDDVEKWSVAIAQVHIPRVTFLKNLRAQLGSSGTTIAQWRFGADTSGSGTARDTVTVDIGTDVFDNMGDNLTKADVLQQMFSTGFYTALKGLRADPRHSNYHWNDTKNTPMYQRFVWEGDDLVLKNAGTTFGRNSWLRIDRKMIDLLGLLDQANDFLNLYPRGIANYNVKDQIFELYGSGSGLKLYLYGDVDWVFVNMKSTPWLSPSIVDKIHVDVRCDLVDSTNAMLHGVVGYKGVTITPSVRDYKPLLKSSVSSIRVWISPAGSSTPVSSSLHDEKTHVVLHFKKEKQNLRGDYRREHPTMVF